jgi:hypothetical protein
VLYDAGALIAADRGNTRFLALHRAWLRGGVTPYVPPAVVAQVWRSSRQVDLARLLIGCRACTLDFDPARRVGELLAIAGTSDVVDAEVIAAAELLHPLAVVTSDRADLAHLADAARLEVKLVEV